jgi:hypothetical protein
MGLLEGGLAIGGSLLSGLMGSSGASKAADASQYAAQLQTMTAISSQERKEALYREQQAKQEQLYREQLARGKPFYDLGVESIPQMKNMVSGNYDMNASPAARYELKQGSTALNRQLAARGLLGSGNAAHRLAELSSGVAAKDYNDQYNRILDQIKVGTGSAAAAGNASNTYNSAVGSSTSGIAGSIGNAANSVSNAQGQAGQARAALYSGQGGMANNMLNTGINAYNALSYGGNSYGSNYGNSGSGGMNLDSALTDYAVSPSSSELISMDSLMGY